jgi:endonuclease/exonuclease/phosphatase family metal-dependent hydrolase
MDTPDNRFIQYVDDIEPVNDRLCVLKLRHAAPISIIAVYIPQAFIAEEEKEAVYKVLTEHTRKSVHKGPCYVTGDFNARIQARISTDEEAVIGPHTFDKHNADPLSRSDEVVQNRQLFIDYLTNNRMKAMNTYFQKPDEKLATFRDLGSTREDPIQRGTHEQIDFIVTPERWKNAIKDAESHSMANIDSDHYPVAARISIKLKAIRQDHRSRMIFQECNKEENEHINQLLHDMESNTSHEYIKTVAALAKNNLPQMPHKTRKVPFSQTTQEILERRERQLMQQMR